MIRCIWMDIDNTILDFDAFVRFAMREGFKKFSLPAFTESMFPVFFEVNDVLWDRIEQGTGTLEDVRKNRWNLIFKRLGISFDGPVFEQYFRETLHECTIPVPGAFESVRALSRRYMLCAASNGPYEQQIYRMEKAGLSSCFSYIFVSEKIGASKPSAAFFDACLKQLEADPGFRDEPLKRDEILMVGDSLSADIDGALEYGLKTCYFDRKGTGPKGRPVDLCISGMEELQQHL